MGRNGVENTEDQWHMKHAWVNSLPQGAERAAIFVAKGGTSLRGGATYFARQCFS